MFKLVNDLVVAFSIKIAFQLIFYIFYVHFDALFQIWVTNIELQKLLKDF